MPLATLSTGNRIAFDKAAIMRRAFELGRFALQLSRARREPASEINRLLSRFLTKAWAEAKMEAGMLRHRIEQDASARVALAERAVINAAIVAQHGGAEGLRQAIEVEHYRQHMDFAAVEQLQGALATVSH